MFDSVVDILGNLTSLVQTTGVNFAVMLLSLVVILAMIIMFSSRMKNLTKAIQLLTDKVSTPQLDTEKSVIVYNAIMHCYIDEQLNYLREVLELNDIHARRAQIEENIERKFRKITTEETSKLSGFKSVCGDMGVMYRSNLDWIKFRKDVFQLFFNTETAIHQKLNDISLLMYDIVDYVSIKIQEAGVHNS